MKNMKDEIKHIFDLMDVSRNNTKSTIDQLDNLPLLEFCEFVCEKTQTDLTRLKKFIKVKKNELLTDSKITNKPKNKK